MATIRPRDLTLTEVAELMLAGIEFPVCGVCVKATIGGNGLTNHCRSCWKLCSRGGYSIPHNMPPKHGHYKVDGLWYPPPKNGENAYPGPGDVRRRQAWIDKSTSVACVNLSLPGVGASGTP